MQYLHQATQLKSNFNDIFNGPLYKPTEEDYDYYNMKMMELLENYRRFRYLDTESERALTTYMFLTISPPEDTPVSVSHPYIKKILQKKAITDYIYVIEQRGEDTLSVGKGTHYHILFKSSFDKYSYMRREIHNTLKHIIDISNLHIDNIICFRNCKTNQDILKRIEYITGTKKDEVKHLKQQFDVIFRQTNNLQSYYNQHILETFTQEV